jgi:hypothetical protein
MRSGWIRLIVRAHCSLVVYNMVEVHRGVKAAEAAAKNVTFAFLFSGHGSVLMFAKEAQTPATRMPKGG